MLIVFDILYIFLFWLCCWYFDFEYFRIFVLRIWFTVWAKKHSKFRLIFRQFSSPHSYFVFQELLSSFSNKFRIYIKMGAKDAVTAVKRSSEVCEFADYFRSLFSFFVFVKETKCRILFVEKTCIILIFLVESDYLFR